MNTLENIRNSLAEKIYSDILWGNKFSAPADLVKKIRGSMIQPSQKKSGKTSKSSKGNVFEK